MTPLQTYRLRHSELSQELADMKSKPVSVWLIMIREKQLRIIGKEIGFLESVEWLELNSRG